MKKKEVTKEIAKSSKPQTVDEYLSTVPKVQRSALEDLRETIKAATRESEELISYGIPTYKYHGPLVHFVARKNYNSFIVVNKDILETFKSELEGYDTSGTTIHFTAENPIPRALIKKIVKTRMKENEAKAKNK